MCFSFGKKDFSFLNGGAVVVDGMRADDYHVEALAERKEVQAIDDEV